MFVFWLRYTCVLLLQTRKPKETAWDLAESEGLRYREVSRALSKGNGDSELHRMLNEDYAVISRLLRECKVDTLEAQILKADYVLMSVWYRASRWIAPKYGIRCMREMTLILDRLAESVVP